MLRLSCRDYRAAAEAVPEAFGLPHSSASRRYIQRAASWRPATALGALRRHRCIRASCLPRYLYYQMNWDVAAIKNLARIGIQKGNRHIERR